MLRKVLAFFIFFFLLVVFSKSDVEILIDKLVEKGILTEEVANEIYDEIRAEREVEAESQKYVYDEKLIKDEIKKEMLEMMPSWLKNIQFYGDMRLRYEWSHKSDSENRKRECLRLRLNVKTKLNKQWEVGFGLTTGKNPRSGNITFDDAFDKENIEISHAYIQYSPFSCLKIWGGKYYDIKKALWCPSSLLWDYDIRPEGGGIIFNYKNSAVNYFTNAGFFMIDEEKNNSDPIMAYIQPGIKLNFSSSFYSRFAFTYYLMRSVRGHSLSYSAGTNTRDASGNLKYSYTSFGLSAELGWKNLFSKIEYFSLIGDYIYNFDPNSDNQGFLAGVKLGNKNIYKKGAWQLTANYRYLERDAWLDTFPNSSSYSGSTNQKGYYFHLKYGLNKNVAVGCTYCRNDRIKGNGHSDAFKTDLMVKF